MGFLIEVAAGALRAAGQNELADWVKNAPAKLGETLVKVFQTGIQSDGTFTADALAELKNLMHANPPQTPPPPTDLLSEYLVDLNGLATRASSLPAVAVAVRGFLHCKDCLALWHFIKQPPPLFRIEKDPTGGPPFVWVKNSGIEIYIGPAIEDKGIEEFNVALEKKPTAAVENIKKACESQVIQLTKNSVTLSPIRAAGRHDSDKADVDIENSEGIAEAFRTMDLAIETQRKRIDAWRKNR